MQLSWSWVHMAEQRCDDGVIFEAGKEIMKFQTPLFIYLASVEHQHISYPEFSEPSD